MENKLKHLEFIQGVINRLANNSFMLKGWSVIVVSALFVLDFKNTDSKILYLALLPIIAFWILDGYFLWQERLYGKLYDKVRELKEEEINFSMDVSSIKEEAPSWCQTIFSKTLFIFHGILLGALLIVSLIKCK
ncbi:hypothetical protein HY745_13105 [Candidatus Desantisbacteria bacterium]|nr:hypothetical protein [Candidatus Desantisbacteria bacterium]